MRRYNPKFYLPLLGLILASAIAGFFWSRVDPNALAVRQLISRLNTNGNYQEPEATVVRNLVRLGPRAYPELARILRAHDTVLDRQYDQLRARFWNSVGKFLPDRVSKDQLRAKASAVVSELGPSACRQLVGTIHDVLRADQNIMGYELLRCLYWSIPDSPKTVETLRLWLSRPAPHRTLFGMKDADEIWPQVPQLAPLLAEWLNLSDQARDAATGLGQMGSNAIFAIPALIRTFEHFVAGQPPHTNLANGYAPGMNPLEWNRTAALTALGRIGVASSNVLSVFERGISDPQPNIRVFTADAIGLLGHKALPLLPKLLKNLDTSNRMVLEYQIEAIGKMGPEAVQAVPVLKHWASEETVATLPPAQKLGRVVRWFDDPPALPGGAAIALLRIRPQEAVGYGKVIAAALLPGPNAQWGEHSPEKLRTLRPLSTDIVPELEAGFGDPRQWVKQLAAFQIMCLNPEHEKAKALLKAAMKEAEPISLRAQAAAFYWQVTGDTQLALPVLSQALESVKDGASQPPLNYAAELGAAAKTLVPQILPLLTNKDGTIRSLAGKALRRIAPESLPPINEGSP